MLTVVNAQPGHCTTTPNSQNVHCAVTAGLADFDGRIQCQSTTMQHTGKRKSARADLAASPYIAYAASSETITHG
jgi:hypothetical protein